MRNSEDFFEIKTTDLAGRIASIKTKTSQFETPALLPVIHPLRQSVPCREIRKMGYSAVMTNAYTTYTKMKEDRRSIHEIIDFDGSIMTDSGGYQALEFGSVQVTPEEIARFEESIGSDIAIILDKPTGLNVTKAFAHKTVEETLEAARSTKKILSRDDMIWTLPIQGGRYVDLIRKSAKYSASLGYDCFALGSPVEVMDEYDFSLLVEMIISAKSNLPRNKPFHLFGAGHPLILPLAVALGCDMFDSASYMLYAKTDRYISSTGTTRLEQLDYLSCTCPVCSSFTAPELKATNKDDRIGLLARHNLAILRQTMLEIKQAIWEGRLWELVASNSRNHPRVFEAFKNSLCKPTALSLDLETATQRFKDRGLFIFEEDDLSRPEVKRHRSFLKNVSFSTQSDLLILPETKTKPFLKSDIFEEVFKIVSNRGAQERTLVTFVCPNYGLVPAEISDAYPLSQTTSAINVYPDSDPVMNSKRWESICILVTDNAWEKWGRWITTQLATYFGVSENKVKISHTAKRPNRKVKTSLSGAKSYRTFKKMIQKI
jgi:7-cyano-7-deazaguanine tRNA-ribosyltransferase